MTDKETRRLSPKAVQADQDAHTALDTIEGYAPANSKYTAAALGASATKLANAQKAEVKAEAALAAARDNAAAAEWEFHDLVLGMKDQVRAQFGPNSNEWQALGQKKKSEFKRPAARKAAKPGA